jgi:hypothetical protein
MRGSIKEFIKEESIFIMATILVLSFSSDVLAKSREQVQAEKAARAKKIELEKRRKKIKAAKDKLNDTQWQIVLRSAGAESGEIEDTLRFTEGKVKSDRLSSEGFSATNFSVNLQGDNIIIWETMQSSENSGIAFWRGEVEGDVMKGLLSRHLDEDTVRDYSFVSTSKGVLEKEDAIEEEAASVEESPKEEIEKVATEEEPVKTDDKKKKKWIW